MKGDVKNRMSTWYIYKTKKDIIVAVGLGEDAEGTAKMTVLDNNIPPSPAKLIGLFKADAQRDYINQMIPILLENIKNDPEIIKMYEQIKKEGL